MNSNIRGSSQAEPTITCSLRNGETEIRRIPAYVEVIIIVMLLILAGWMLGHAFEANDRINAQREKEQAAMVKVQRDGWDLNPDGTLADTPHNRELKGKK